ncbi:cytochrome P460 family protein [Beggiatoa alba]|nr:cytochrome P460 family protein [Beggiatoa alba]
MKKIELGVMLAGMISISADVLADTVPYPDGYRNWNHVKTMLITPKHPLAKTDQGIHHIYANKKAMQGLKTGKYFDGAILVYDLLKYHEKNHTVQEGGRKLLGVMYKDDNKYGDTGGWGFEGFLGNSKTKRLVTDKGKNCFSCHEPLKDKKYVFTELRK